MHSDSKSLFYYLVHWLVAAFALLITAKLIPGIELNSFTSAMWAAIMIGFINIFIWPVLMIFTLPLNILTLGLFTFVINGAVLKICSGLIPDFIVVGWWPAIIGALVLSLISSVLHLIFA